MKRNICLLIILLGLTFSCRVGKPASEVEFTGTIGKPGMTSYQYGTHIITNGEQRYALTSDIVDLDEYVGEEVTIYADKLEGYPVDGGPVFLAVKKVKD